jgi:exoribonuclease R
MKYTLHIEKRNYSKWTWIQEDTQEPIAEQQLIEFPFPIPNQLFHGDQYCSTTKKISLISPLRTEKAIPGTLILEGNRTYGRQVLGKTTSSINLFTSISNSAKGRLYYRCIPQNPHYPAFLIPYKPPLDFSKHTTNLFVLFQYKEWIEKTAPYGGLIESIGAVNHLPSYYRYLLVSKKLEFHPNHWIPKSLHTGIPETETENKNEKKQKEKGGEFIFSIDPKESRDLDDAFSFHWRETAEGRREAVVRVYIADVVYWMDFLGIWDALRLEKIGCSTIYLPDQNHPLLPRWISDKEGSLLETKKRPVVGLEWVFRGWETGAVECSSQRFFRDSVVISKNYRYDTSELEKCKNYQEFLDFTRCLIHLDKNRNRHMEMKDSHDLVEYWMIEYNIYAGNALAILGKGIFRRTQSLKSGDCEMEVAGEGAMGAIGISTQQFLKHYKNTRGEYVLYDDSYVNPQSEVECMLHTTIREGKCVYYAHASSPLRRMVDIYNQLGLILGISQYNKEEKGKVEECKENMEKSRREFQKHVEMNVEEINRQNRMARRIQNECEMLSDFFSCSYEVSNELYQSYEGTVVDWDLDKEKSEVKGYWVFLEWWKRLVYVERQRTGAGGGYEEILKIGETGKYQIFLFEEEEKAHKKIVVRRENLPQPVATDI